MPHSVLPLRAPSIRDVVITRVVVSFVLRFVGWFVLSFVCDLSKSKSTISCLLPIAACNIPTVPWIHVK